MTDEFDDYDADDLDDRFDEYFDIHEPSDDYGDDRASLRGTSQCDGLCDPMCNWCLVSHSCPADCLGGPCPYESLDPSIAGNRDWRIGNLDAHNHLGKRYSLTRGVSRRHYLQGFESWIRRKDPRRRAKETAKRKREVDWSMVF